MFKFILIIPIFLVLSLAEAAITNSYLGIGTMTEYVNKVQMDPDGSKNKFEFNPGLITGLAIPLNKEENINFCPEFGVLFPTHTEGGDITRLTYFLWGNFNYIIKKFTLRVGYGFHFVRISSTGGTKTLGNGNSTSKFYLPPTTSTSYNAVVQFGPEYYFTKSISARVDGSLFNISDRNKRAYAYMFSVNYHINPSALGIFSD